MPERMLYEYSVLRYVPDIEREEFVNVGLVMMCKRRRWLRIQTHLEPSRIAAFASEVDIDAFRSQLDTFERIARAHPDAGVIAALPAEERFRWLTAVKSCALQTSRPHPGLTDDLDLTFDRLFNKLVL